MSTGFRMTGILTRRTLILAAVAGTAAAVLSALLVWIEDIRGTPAYGRLAIAALTVLEWTYLAAVAAVVVGLPTATAVVARRRRRGTTLSRAWLTLAAMAVALAMAEGIAAAWPGATSDVPVGGLPRGMQVDPQTIWPPVTSDDVELPRTFPPRDPADPIELLVIGESSAQGVPYSGWVSIGQMVAWKLTEAIPTLRVRLQVLANSGDTLELQHRRLATIPRRPDLVIVYAGHNEFGSRINGAREVEYYTDDLAPTPAQRLLEWAEAVSPVCGLIRRSAERHRLSQPATGRRDLIDRPAYTHEEASVLLSDFHRRLDAIVDFAVRNGAICILIAPPANDAGYEPNRSYLRADTPRAEREAFRHEFGAARRLEKSNPLGAIAAYQRLVASQPGFAESHYRLAFLLDRAGDAERAFRHFVAARDADGYPIRCLSSFQEAYADVAARYPAILIDGPAELHAIGRRGRLDDWLFQDAMHPSLKGQIALAQAVLRELKHRGAFGWSMDGPPPTIDPSACAAHFGIGLETWKALCLWGVHFGTYVQGLRYDPAPHLRRRTAYAAAYDRLVAGEPVSSLGLPNVGIPTPVPAIPVRERQPDAGSRGPRAR